MEIALLNQCVTVLANRVITDAVGNHEARWIEAFSLWANVKVDSSSEKQENARTQNTQTLKLTVRQNARTRQLSTTQNAISFEGDVWDIVSIIPDYAHRQFLTLVVQCRR